MNAPRQTQTVVVQDEQIVDFKMVGDIFGFIRNAIARNRKKVFFIFITASACMAVVAAVLPRVYQIDTRILTHKTAVMPALVHPDRSIPQAADAPTAGAEELIKSRENLENLMKDVQLEAKWGKKRSWFFRIKDQAQAAILGPPAAQDVHESFLKLLDERIVAKVNDDVVSMRIEWPDPDIAMSLAEGVVARFRKIRHDMELNEIQETVHILERNVEISRRGIEESVGKIAKIFAHKERELVRLQTPIGKTTPHHHRVRRDRVIAIRRPLSADEPDPMLREVKKSLSEKQAKMAVLKQHYEQGIKKAQEELNTLRANLGPQHPDVIEAQHHLEESSRLPKELANIQAEETELATQLANMPQKTTSSLPKVQVQVRADPEAVDDTIEQTTDTVRLPVSDALSKRIEADPEISSAMNEIKKQEDAHDELLLRLENARIESETAGIAFEYRYLLTEPPVYPKQYVRPNVTMLAGGGVVVGLVLGILAAIMTDTLSKRILESWQIERFLHLKVLGEIEDS